MKKQWQQQTIIMIIARIRLQDFGFPLLLSFFPLRIFLCSILISTKQWFPFIFCIFALSLTTHTHEENKNVSSTSAQKQKRIRIFLVDIRIGPNTDWHSHILFFQNQLKKNHKNSTKRNKNERNAVLFGILLYLVLNFNSLSILI